MLVAVIIAGSLIVAAAAAEVVLRLLGLGDPPLWDADPEIEYLPLPSQSMKRFGRLITYNSHRLRSREFPAAKTDPAERRLLVVGDSVLHGGAATDHDALATTMLERRLISALDRPVVVANISAGSWGPPNYLAFIKRFGLFDADAMLIVVNSPDYADAPTFRDMRGRATRKPTLALQEITGKYLPRLRRRASRSRQGPRRPTDEDIRWCLDSLRELVGMARAAGLTVGMAQHLKLSELEGGEEEGHGRILAVARELGIEPVQLGGVFREAVRAGGKPPYMDDIHPDDRGQKILAGALFEPALALLDRPDDPAGAGVPATGPTRAGGSGGARSATAEGGTAPGG